MTAALKAGGSRSGVVAVTGIVMMLALVADGVYAQWPQFLGSQRDGIAETGKGLLRKWPADGLAVLWRVPVGGGFGGAAIHNDSVLVLDREGNERDVIRRIRLADGKDIWRSPYDAPGKLDHDGSRSTPATDGKLVFTIGPFGHFNAVNFSDGSSVWKADLLKDWDAGRPGWGVAQSPLLMGDLVIVAPWGKKAALVAYNKKTGDVVWTTPNPDGVAQDYQSPVPMTLHGRPMIVASGQKAYTIGVDPQTGGRLWTYNAYTCRIHIPSPTRAGEDRILLTGGYGAGGAMFKVEREGDEYVTSTLWKSKSMGSKIAQPLVYEDHIYGNSSDTGGALRCITFEGDTVWDSKGKATFGMGNLLLADGLILIVNGGSGELSLCEATPDGFQELGRAPVLKGKDIWGPLAYSDGKLVLRDQTQLVCVDLKGAPE